MQIKKLLIAVSVPLLIGSLSSVFTAKNIENWFKQLIQPSFAPPNYLFGIVWTILYILMGMSFYIFWTKKTDTHWKPKGYSIFGIQLVLNFLWSIIFFNLHWMGIALIEIIVLWVAIFLNILVFSRISKISAWLLVPYISWVSFASMLNFYYWDLNRII